MQGGHQRNDGIVKKTCHFRGQIYITIVSNIIQTYVTNTCRFDTCQESFDIWKKHEFWISTWQYLPWNQMTWTRLWNTSRYIQTLTGLKIQWRGKAHLAHCDTLINFSWWVNVEDKELLPCPVETQKCMLLMHCQLSWFSYKSYWKIGPPFLIHARADRSTARARTTKKRASRKMKHIHTRFLFIQDLVFRKLLTMSSVKTDVNPSDIGTKALDVNDSTDWDQCLPWGTELSETSSPGKWYSGDEWQWKSLDTSMMDWTSRIIDTCEHTRRFLKIFSVQRGTFRESDTASWREETCLLNQCNAVAQ